MSWCKRNAEIDSDEENIDSLILDDDQRSNGWPIVYDAGYNISFLGIEKLHPFDSGKWGRIYGMLLESHAFEQKDFRRPKIAERGHLRRVHTPKYLNSLNWSVNVARVTEVPPVSCLPNKIVQRVLLQPLRLQTGGSVASAQLAMTRKVPAIHLGGGFHHCSGDSGGGFCAYADISLIVNVMRELFRTDNPLKFLIVDLDAHQGNGHENDFMYDKDVDILDVYNEYIYPGDHHAKQAIEYHGPIRSHTVDDVYLTKVEKLLDKALNNKYDLIIYNAGTDILQGDPLGNLDISADGVIKRDQLVFTKVFRENETPLVMLTSGGYQHCTAQVIADSIMNLKSSNLFVKNSSTENAPQICS